MSLSEYEQILEEFFELKTNYESEYMQKKSSIINKKDISNKQKRKLIESIKLKCIGCKKPVGTIFYDKNRTYGAMCGNTESPCSLNITIKKQNVININNMIESFDKEISNNEFNINKMKLYLIFGLIKEDDLISFYETEKEEYNSNIEFRETLINELENKTNDAYRKEQIKEIKDELQVAVNEIKLNMKEYLVNENYEGLKNAVTIYDEYIVDIIQRLRANKYSHQGLEIIDDQKHNEQSKIIIKQLIHNVDDFELAVEDGEIVNFEK